jgi:hypothetical protein
MKMQNPKSRSLAENPQPIGGLEFLLPRSELEGIGTIYAVQRATVGNLGDQCEWILH